MNKLGFGILRLTKLDPNDEKSIDVEKAKGLVDAYLTAGGNYFDTAYTYNEGASETTVREALVKRHPRDRFRLTDKLPSWMPQNREDCWRLFREQLERCGVTYFDNYLLHWLSADNYAKCEQYDGFGFLRELKEQGLVKHIGFSYHDKAEVLDRILTEHLCTEYVQLQLNYLDWESVSIEARKCYEVAVKHRKKVLVMEPVKGGTLAKLPAEAEALLRDIHPQESPSSWALRFAMSQEQVEVVLSGMNELEQVHDNMRDKQPMTQREYQALEKVSEIIRSKTAVPCTGCRYCISHARCPKQICIPDYFELYNEYMRFDGDGGWKLAPQYLHLRTDHGAPDACIVCRQCEKNCPQHLPITDYLKKAAEAFKNL